MAVEVCEIWWLFFFSSFFFFFFFVIINFNCSITVCIPLALLEMRHSECEMVSTGSFFFCTGGQERPCSGLQAHSHSLSLFLCFPECHRHHSARLRYVNTSLP